MIAVDTNLLILFPSFRQPLSPCREGLLDRLRRGGAAWAIPWPCVHEFMRVVTHPRIFRQPTPLAVAFDTIDAWLAGGSLSLLCESDGYLDKPRRQATAARSQGQLIHDARIAALCLHHGVRELWLADRDFDVFPQLKVRNPLQAH
jgi:predicted nucleic acid-binding protein